MFFLVLLHQRGDLALRIPCLRGQSRLKISSILHDVWIPLYAGVPTILDDVSLEQPVKFRRIMREKPNTDQQVKLVENLDADAFVRGWLQVVSLARERWTHLVQA